MSDGNLDTSSVQRPGAFFGRITLAVRETAASLFEPAEGTKSLDVGCGNGLFFASLRTGSGTLIGADRDLGLLREARQVFRDNQTHNAALAQGDALALPFPDETFDEIFLLNTLINIPTREAVQRLLGELMRVCRPGGRIWVDIRNAANPYLRVKYWCHNVFGDFPTRTHDLGQIQGIFTSQGFEILGRHRIGPGFPLGPPAFLIEARRLR